MNQMICTQTSTTSTTTKYECDVCKDVGVIKFTDDQGYESGKDCECTMKKWQLRMLGNSGISKAFREKTLDNYITDNDIRIKVKRAANDYIENFNDKSFSILGQVGSGKTHIIIAIANQLLSKGIVVKYAQYGTMINEILAAKNDIIQYNNTTRPYKNARVLLIDDLFKGAITTWNGEKKVNNRHTEVIFDILNHRYLNNKAIIISSELTPNQLLELDEGIASRILEMSKGYRIIITDKNMNHRI